MWEVHIEGYFREFERSALVGGLCRMLQSFDPDCGLVDEGFVEDLR